ncbi:MAG: hypothetical protein A3D27_00800 [Omnitrophica WOR_2 bacterium RIFCSPHIGHO2_02_FULL_46_37]|nr:MAG: hypothetical protein A3D27_00800 [Omnitrophica WOR_2 bacterium RIFCSPHIGHO2_02_FULL_46_37]
MFSFLIFFIILSVMILVHEFGHFAQARRLGIRVERFSLGFGPKLLSYKKDWTEYVICALPFGGYVKLAGDNWADCKGERYEFLGRRPFERAKVIFAGPALNYILAFICFWLVNLIGYPNITAKVGELMAGYPAEASGIAKGDLITAVDGKSVQYWPELQEIIRGHKAPQVELEILRDSPQRGAGRKIIISVGLRQEAVKNLLGKEQKINLIGIKPHGEVVLAKHNVFEGFILAGRDLFRLTALTLEALARMVSGGLSVRENVTGPLGMFFITSGALRLGLSAVLHLVAVLSASLGIFNLLPLPVLDGGHIFFLGLEKLRGRHLNQKTEEKITQLGFGFITILAFFVFWNDLVRFGILTKALEALGKVK